MENKSTSVRVWGLESKLSPLNTFDEKTNKLISQFDKVTCGKKPILPVNLDKVHRQVLYAEKYTPIINRYLRGEGTLKAMVADAGVGINQFNHETYQVYLMRSSLMKHFLGEGVLLSEPVLKTEGIAAVNVPLKRTNNRTPLVAQTRDVVFYKPKSPTYNPDHVCQLTKGVVEGLFATVYIKTDAGRCEVILDNVERRRAELYVSGTATITMQGRGYPVYVDMKLESIYKGEVPVGRIGIQVSSSRGGNPPYVECVKEVTLTYGYRLHQVKQKGIKE